MGRCCTLGCLQPFARLLVQLVLLQFELSSLHFLQIAIVLLQNGYSLQGVPHDGLGLLEVLNSQLVALHIVVDFVGEDPGKNEPPCIVEQGQAHQPVARNKV